MKKKNGFTLIELLAVIIILGVLMIIAVPAVTKYINDSRKSSYVNTAKTITGGVRNLVNSGEYEMYDKDITYYVDGSCVKTENGFKSPYGDFEKAYIAVTVGNNGNEYYWVSVDETGTGVKTLKKIDNLDNEDIVGDIQVTDVTTSVGIDGRKKIVVIGGDDCTKGEPTLATQMMNGRTGKLKNACGPVTDTIYWALQDTNNDETNDKLIISDSEVSGVYSGSFAGDTSFDSHNEPPWTAYWLSGVSDVEIEGTVSPVSIAYWFEYVGSNVENLNLDLNDLDVCNVTDMSYAFYDTGQYSDSFILNLADWETSSVETTYCMFCSAGQAASTWRVDGINNWDVSSVENMAFMFEYAGYAGQSSINMDLSGWDTSSVNNMTFTFYYAFHNATSFNINLSGWTVPQDLSQMFNSAGYRSTTFNLNVSNWDTSRTKIMNNLFYGIGHDATTWSLQGLDTWDTSKLESASYMLFNSAYNASNFNLDLRNWNTSNLKNMYFMFYDVGYQANSLNLNLSGWDISKVTNFYGFVGSIGAYSTTCNLDVSNWNLGNITELNNMFWGVGQYATNVNLNASNWDTSNVTSMYSAFGSVGNNSTTIRIDLTGWTSAKVTNMSYMFDNTGANATNFTIIIPSTNGNGINHTSNTMYGNSPSIKATLPEGKTFTFVS